MRKELLEHERKIKDREAIEVLSRAMQGNPDAVDFCLTLNSIVEKWDDLHDGDKQVSKEDINRAFTAALIGLPRNPFYRRYMEELLPVMTEALLAWHDSNELAKGGDHDRKMAWMLKQQVTRVCNHCAYIIGGLDWYRTVGADICRIFTETQEEYLQETSDGV